MTMNAYDIGGSVKVSVTFTLAGLASDPTTVTCTTRDPAGTTTVQSVVRDGTGLYHAVVDLTGAMAGTWNYRWAGVGGCQAAEEGQFFVEPSYVLSQEP